MTEHKTEHHTHHEDRVAKREVDHAKTAAEDKAKALTKSIKADVAEVKEFAAEKKEELSVTVQEKVQDVQDYAADKQEEINKSVHEHPYATAAGAFAGGVAVGAMMSKHKDDKDSK